MTQALYRRIDRPTIDAASSMSIPPACLPALAHLAERMLFARARGDDASHAATSLAELSAAGVTTDDCLALISHGLLIAAPAPEKQRRKGSSARSGKKLAVHARSHGRRWSGDGFESLVGKKVSVVADHKLPRVGPRTRTLLSDAGLALVTRHAQSCFDVEPSTSISPALLPSISPSLSHSVSPLLPRYDSEARELIVAEVVILRLPAQARSLAAVLMALERSGWKPRVAKPLSGRPGGNDPHHLAIAAYKLNARQSLIEFHADDGAFRWNWRPNIDRRVIER